MTNREIDTLVAEHIFEYKLKREDCNSYWVDSEGVEPCHGHDYSSEIQDAWEIVEKMKEKEVHVNVLCCADGTFGCEIENRVYKGEPDTWFSGWKETAPLAICLAALSALGVKYE